MGVAQAIAEIEGVLEKHGIGTHLIVLKDPDSDSEVTIYNGSCAWICGQAVIIEDLMKVSYNSGRYVSDDEMDD